MTAPSRRAALRVLQRLRGSSTTLAEILVHERDQLSDPRDRALTTEIASGTVRRRAAIDAVLSATSTRPLDRLDPIVLDILRMSTYQLLHLDRLPARAVVDDAVALTKEARFKSASGFVNAVLRKVDAARDRLPLPERPHLSGANHPEDKDAAIAYLSVTLSHPAWLVSRWLERHGFEATERWARFNNQPAPLTLRTNVLATSRARLIDALREEGLDVEPTARASEGLVVRNGNPFGGETARRGWFVAQDEASQLVGELAGLFVGSCSLDACAAPGGKTLILAAAAASRPAQIVATDRRRRRVHVLRDTVERGAPGKVSIAQVDLRTALPFHDIFDLVLIDAPCSGLGTFRREPDIKWRRSPGDIAGFASAQRRMLDIASSVVKPGGYLVYATCSSEPEENEHVAEAFLDEHGVFRAVLPEPTRLTPGLRSVINEAGYLRTWPHVHELEAFFAAVFQRGAVSGQGSAVGKDLKLRRDL
jgi:16S rRNA (cytosine967-C5)-methyltransferase